MSSFKFDVLARAVDGVQERTVCGAIVSVSSLALIGVLLLAEMRDLISTTSVHHIGVDDGDKPFGAERWTVPDRLPVNLHMTFAHLKCDDLMLEIDATRGLSSPVNHLELRAPTTSELAWAPGAEASNACTLDGRLTVGKVSASFHVAVQKPPQPHGGFQGLPMPFAALAGRMMQIDRYQGVNISHRVHALHFGERVADMAAPLDGVVNAPEHAGQQHYLVKVIPTVLERAGRRRVHTNQYSLAEQFIATTLSNAMGQVGAVPGVYFFYDFFPVMIQVVEERPGFAKFLVSVCAIVGGIFAVASILDGIIFRSAKVISGKAD